MVAIRSSGFSKFTAISFEVLLASACIATPAPGAIFRRQRAAFQEYAEGRRGTEIDDDGIAAVFAENRFRVDDGVGAEPAGIIVAESNCKTAAARYLERL
jgi:hypothetical protein